MKLKTENGKVTFLYRTGSHFSRNEMNAAAAQIIVDHAKKITKSDNPDYPICVDDTYLFPGTYEKPAPKKPKAKAKAVTDDLVQPGQEAE